MLTRRLSNAAAGGGSGWGRSVGNGAEGAGGMSELSERTGEEQWDGAALRAGRSETKADSAKSLTSHVRANNSSVREMMNGL